MDDWALGEEAGFTYASLSLSNGRLLEEEVGVEESWKPMALVCFLFFFSFYSESGRVSVKCVRCYVCAWLCVRVSDREGQQQENQLLYTWPSGGWESLLFSFNIMCCLSSCSTVRML